MTAGQWLGIGMMLVVAAAGAFAFRQGERVRPSGRDPNRSENNEASSLSNSGYDPGGHSGGDAGGGH